MQHKAQKGLRVERERIIKECQVSRVRSLPLNRSCMLTGPAASAQGRPSLTPTHLRVTSPHSEGWSGRVRPAHTRSHTHTHTSKPAFLVIYDLGGLLDERKFACDATGITEHDGSSWGTFFCLDQIRATSFRLKCDQTFLETEMLWPLRPASGAPTHTQTTLTTTH